MTLPLGERLNGTSCSEDALMAFWQRIAEQHRLDQPDGTFGIVDPHQVTDLEVMPNGGQSGEVPAE